MEILDSIIWDMSTEPNKAIIWDSIKKDYRYLSVSDFNTKIGLTMVLKYPLDLVKSIGVLDISYTNTIGDLMRKLNSIYSNIYVIDSMDGMLWFRGLSEIDYPNYALNVSK